jgi:YD repeat-containing protein
MLRKVFRTVFFLVLLSFAIPVIAQHHSSDSQLDQYVEQVSELSSRARANVYFANPQSLFKGVQVSFVNVGTGNITFLRRDLVASGRMPLVLARVYDSSVKSSVDFGAGWRLSAAETISIGDAKAHLFREDGSIIDFVKSSDTVFRLEKDYPSDYSVLIMNSPDAITVSLRTGFVKEFKLIEGSFRLAAVTDRNGNEVRLSYDKGLLSRLENSSHFVQLTRNEKGRVIAAQDDQGRSVHYVYDNRAQLIEADDLGGRAWQYAYTDEGKLKTAIDPLQRLNFAVFYDDAARVRRLQLPSGVIQFNYDVENRSTTVIDRKDLVSKFFQNDDGITTRIVNALGEETAIGLDQSRNPIVLSRNGSVIEKMEYDQEHRILARHSITDSGTVDRRYGYDPTTGLLANIHSSADGNFVFARDGKGNLSSASLTDGLHKYSYSDAGDLANFSAGDTKIGLSQDRDGLIASLTELKGAVSTMRYKAGGELSEVIFASGRTAKYTYGASGLRSKLSYNDGWAVEYSYDPAGNLASTKILDPKGVQIGGQVLTLDESYRLIQQATFAGKITNFEYDKNGNLTMIKEGKSITKFEYDALNRLTEIITPQGERLPHPYQPGERSIVEEYEHSKPLVGDRWDTGLTFGLQSEILAARSLSGSLGPIRFAENLGTFQLQNAEGTEIVTPDTALEQPLHKLQLVSEGTPLQSRQNQFNRPFNPVFMPAEYATINCCPMCITNPARCWECDPGPTDPTSITSMDPDQEDLGSTSFQVTFTGTFSGSVPHITFDKSGISATIQSHNTFGISATFDITNATVGTYVVTVTDTGGSDTASLTLSPFINSIEPARGLAGGSVDVTISGKGFGTNPSITVGGGVTVTRNSTSDTQITATLNIPNTAGGDQPLTVTNQGFSTQGDTFFGQVPSHLGVITDTGATQNFSCSVFGLNYNGIQRQILYNVLDQQTQPIQAHMTVSESFGAISNSCGGPNTPTPTTGATTDPTGTFPGPDLLAICSSACLPADASGNPTGSCTLKVNQTWTANNLSVRTNVVTYNCNDVTVTPQ